MLNIQGPRLLPLMLLVLLLNSAGVQAGAPKVVVSIQPIHSLVSSLMRDVAQPQLLISGGNSPHDFTLRPSDARKLNSADLVIWIGETMESSLASIVKSIDGEVLELLKADNLDQLPARQGGIWEKHLHGHEDEHRKNHEEEHEEEHATHDDENHGDSNPHIWLSPNNAITIVKVTEQRLIELDPGNREKYQENAQQLLLRIMDMDRMIEEQLSGVKNVPYIVFHDAYQAFEAHYGLNAVGSVTLNPDRLPGARRIHQLQERIQKANVRCVFSEPQFEPRLVDTIIERSDAKRGVLDPIGSQLESGPEAYFLLMKNITSALNRCLGP